MKGKFSKTGLILVGGMLVCLILFLAVGMPKGFLSGGGQSGDLDDEDTPGIGEVVKGNTPLLIFDKSESAKILMEAFDNGEIAKVEILYDQAGANSSVESEDQAVIRQAYKALKNITVADTTDESVTDAYHHVYFTLETGAEIGYDFEGPDILVYHDGTAKGTNYDISGSQGLWKLYNKMCNGVGSDSTSK